MKLIIATVLAGLTASPALANLNTPNPSTLTISVMGDGSDICKMWNQNDGTAENLQELSWLMGSFTGMEAITGAMTGKNVSLKLQGRRLLDQIDSYCQDNPGDTLQDVAWALFSTPGNVQVGP